MIHESVRQVGRIVTTVNAILDGERWLILLCAATNSMVHENIPLFHLRVQMSFYVYEYKNNCKH